MRKVRGRVVSGKGDFSKWIALLHEHYRKKTGLDLFPGTLNLELEQEYLRPTTFVRLEKEEYGGQVSVSIIPCRIFGRQAFILRTDGAERDDRKTLEVAADIGLRLTYGLKDGDVVEVEVP